MEGGDDDFPIISTVDSPPLTDSETLDIVGSPDDLEIHEDAVSSSAAIAIAVADDLPPSSSSPENVVVLTDDLKAKIIRQVEYYFSDENLPTDKFLMKYVSKDKDGFVPVAVVASFRKMKKLVPNKSLIVAALKDSSQLVLSSNGKKVRRVHPLPITEVKDGKSCTVFVENLPEDCSKESLQRIFGDVGKIKSISIRDPHSTDNSAKVSKGEMAISGKIHALVEYETVNEAEKAVATLNDDKNWRNGIRVELLLKRMGKYGFPKKGGNEQNDKNRDHHEKNRDHHDKNRDHHDDSGEHDEASYSLHEKPGRNRRGGRGRGQGQSQSNGPGQSQGHGPGQSQSHGQGQYRGGKQHYGHGSAPTGSRMEGPSKPPPGPKMPDGTRGFAMGRGQTLSPPPLPNSIE
ncbi:hypothetical protein ACHQM5_004486 [Ranunculus cassubicifolius]